MDESLMRKSPDQYTDEELFEQLKMPHAQAEAAFSELYRRHSVRLYSYCRRMLGDPNSAQDVFQETFIKFHQCANTNAMSNVVAFLMKIARNLCLNRIRDSKRTVSFEEYHKLSFDMPHEKQELLNLITSALDLLPDTLREAFILREYDGFTYAEIADLVDEPLSTVRIRVHRAKQKIRQVLQPYLADLAED